MTVRLAIPALIAVVSDAGLVAALLRDGVYDVAGWIGSAASVAALAGS